MSEINGTLIAEIDGVKYYTDGVQKGNISISGSIFYVNFGAEYDGVSGTWGDGSSFGGGNFITFEVDGSGSLRVGGSVKGFDAGIVKYADGTYGVYAGASVSIFDDLLALGVSADGTLGSGSNLSSYNTINVYSDGRIQKVEYLPGNSQYPYVIVQVTSTKNGETSIERYSVGDPQVAAKLAAGLMPHLYNPKCFPAGTLISMADGSSKPIEEIAIGDSVLSFEKFGFPVAKAVSRLFRDNTQEWVELRAFTEEASSDAPLLTATPGHHILTPEGGFATISSLMSAGKKSFPIVLVDGEVIHVVANRKIKDEDHSTGIDGVSWRTYNFEVEDFHTYIANGVRVHNDSLFLPQTNEAHLADNILSQISHIIFDDQPWHEILVGSALRSFGTVALDAALGDDEFTADILLGRYALNVVDSVGGFAGRALVSSLIDEADIDPALASALSIFAQQAGSELAQLAALEFLAANAGGTVAFEAQQALDNAANGLDFGAIITSAGFAALGSYAGSQLADLLDMDPELAALVSAPTQAAIVTIGDNIISGNPWNLGISTSMLTSLGSVAGTILANEVGNFDTYTEQLGSSIGSKIGAFVFSSFGPLGTFIGSLVGGLIGGLIGGAFGDDPEGFADLEFNSLEDLYRISRVYGEDKAHKDVAKGLAEGHISIIQSILDLVDGDALPGTAARVTYGAIKDEFTVKIGADEIDLGSNAEGAVYTGVFESVRSLQIAGGDIYARRAIHAILEKFNGELSDRSDALDEMMATLMVAKEYQNYLENISSINAIITADPDSDFALGWQITLAQVFAIGLQHRSEIDWTGGWEWWLQHNEVTVDEVSFTYLDGERWFVLGIGDTPAVLADTIAKGQKDTISGGDSADYIYIDGKLFDGDTSQSGEAGEFIGFNGFDRAGQTGVGFAVRVNGGSGDDQIYGGDLGNDLFGGEGDDFLVGGKLDDWLFGDGGKDILLAGGGLGDVLNGGEGDDRLLGDTSEDWLIGGSGDDILRGFEGADVLEGGAGRDFIQGGEGADKYIFRITSGVDVISDSGKSGTDAVVFGEGITPADLIIHRSDTGDDLIVRISGNDSALLVVTGALLTDFAGIERFEFSDGTVWSKGQILAAISQAPPPAATVAPDAASTTVSGTSGNDDLSGGAGDDVLQGGTGSDVYRFNLGDGIDSIIDAGLARDIDRVVFGAGITASNLRFSKQIDNSAVLTISIDGTTDKLLIRYDNADFSDGVELFEFANGAVLSYRDINKLYLAQNQTTGNDILVGGLSDEILAGGDGNDILNGGGGYDRLEGGQGNDAYVYNKGDGIVVISESSGNDKLVLGAGISPTDIHLSTDARYGVSVVITFRGTPGRIEILNQLSATAIELIEFADGTQWSVPALRDALLARATDRNGDIIFGFNGFNLADVINGGSGDDRISGNDGDDALTGGAGDDVLLGGMGSDTYFHQLGDGSDVIVETAAGGSDRLVLGSGISLGNLFYSQDPLKYYNGWVTFGGGARLSLNNLGLDNNSGLDILQTADGMVLDRQQLLDLFRSSWTSSGKDVIRGFDLSDVVNGAASDDRLSGNAGNDSLTGGTGDDALLGGSADDTYFYELGDGSDVIIEGLVEGDNDALVFGSGISLENLSYSQDPRTYYNGWITFDDGTRLSLLNLALGNGHGIEVLQTADGAVLDRQQLLDLFRSSWMSSGKDVIRGFDLADVMNGDSGDDRLSGSGGNDTLTGGAGDDVLSGGSGDDTYFYELGDGSDAIVEGANSGNNDRLVFGIGISASQLNFSFDAYDTDTLRINFGSGNTLTILNAFGTNGQGIEFVEFYDGTLWSRSAFAAAVGGTGAVLNLVNGDGFANTINGTTGADRIEGLDGADVITGGAGDDYAAGGWGNDTYVFRRGDGRDVFEAYNDYQDTDTLRFGANIAPSDIVVRLDEIDHTFLVLKLAGTTDEIRIKFVERVEFADGTVWTAAQLYQVYADQNSTSGDDYIHTFYQNDTINTGAGDDQIYAEDGADIISGGTGDDYAEGGWGNDTYIFNRGDGRDAFDGHNDYQDTDTLRFGANIASSDIVVRLDEADHTFLVLKLAGTTDEIRIKFVERVEFADGTVWTAAQLYQVYADQNSTSGDDYIHTFYQNDTINTGAGDDQIYSEDGADIISGGAGDDYAYGGWGNDIYIFNRGDGRDVFDGQDDFQDTDTLRFGANIAPSDIVVRLDEADHTFLTLKLAGTTDEIRIRNVERIEFADGTIWTEAQLYRIYAEQNSTSGDDYIQTLDGSDTINGGGGDDRIYAGDRADIISGGAGDDYTFGDWGDDTYIFNRGDGRDVFDGSFSTDTVRFGSTIEIGDLQVFSSSTGWTTIRLRDTGDLLETAGVEFIEFSDGSRVALSQLLNNEHQTSASAGVMSGDSGDNLLTGSLDANRLQGYAGNDVLIGGAGSDTYIFGLGDGHDTIDERIDSGATDTVQLAQGISSSDVFFEASNANANDLIIRIRSRDDAIILKNQLGSDSAGIERIQFADGTIWTRADIVAGAVNSQSTSGDDSITGTYLADIIEGGAGDDVVSGGWGADRYLYSYGDGNDQIIDFSSPDQIDELVFQFAYSGSGIAFVRTADGESLIITVGGSTLVVDQQFNGSGYGIDRFTFTSGEHFSRSQIEGLVMQSSMTAGNDTILGTSGDDTIAGDSGDDHADGGAGNDQYLFSASDGHDAVHDLGGDTSTDILRFDASISAASIVITRELDGSYRLADSSEAWSVTLQGGYGGIEQIRFADNTYWTQEILRQKFYQSLSIFNDGTIDGDDSNEIITATASAEIIHGDDGDDQINGGDGNDTIFGDAGNDTLGGGAGDDVLEGGLGLDQYDGGNGFDTVHFGYSVGDWVVDLVSGTAHTVANSTADETLVSIEAVVTGSGDDLLHGSSQHNVLTAGTGNDRLFGNEGNDTLIGGKGNDTLAGNSGGDIYVYASGDGYDSVNDDSNSSSDVDVLKLTDLDQADVEFIRSGVSLIMTVVATGETIFVNNQFNPAHGYAGIEKIEFADGSFWNLSQINDIGWIRGTAGADTLTGTWKQEIIAGGAGNDTLIGEWGSDTYLFNVGDGHDSIQDWDDPVSTDILVLGAGIEANSVSVERGPNLWDIVLNFGTSGSVTIANGFYTPSSVIEQVRFSDNTVWLQEDLRSRFLAQAGTSAGETIYGFIDRDDLIEGHDGNDDLNGVDGNDTLLGGVGYDILFGGEGDDTLDGEADSDTMIGNMGSDTYLYASGGGYDYVHDEDNTATDVDVLRLTDLDETDVDFMRSGLSLVVTILATGETVFIEDQFNGQDGGHWGVEKIEFADGSFWNLSQINDIGWIRGTAGADTLTGSWKQEIIAGGAGNDTLIGEWGSDTYLFNIGDGHDSIQDWDDPVSTDVLLLGAGIEANSVSVERGPNLWDVVLNFGTSGSVTIANGFYTPSSVIEQVRFSDNTVWLQEDLRSRFLTQAGTSAGETIYGFIDRDDLIEGHDGNDDLNGVDGNDTLRGQNGDDFLVGENGDDILDGGAGDDGLMGGAGNDVFVFRPGLGHDWVADFVAGAGSADVIDISSSLFANFQVVLLAASQSGNDTIITHDADNSITLSNVARSSLHADDFRFVA